MIVKTKKLSDKQKCLISLELCKTDKRLIESSDEYIQLLNILIYINMISNEKTN